MATTRAEASSDSTVAARWGAAIVVLCFLASALILSQPSLPFSTHGYRSGTTIYPWWTWALLLVGLSAGVVSGVDRRNAHTFRSVASACGFVAAAQLTGLGVVAARHWRPASGMGGGYGGADDIRQLQHLAVGLALAGALAATLLALQLVSGSRSSAAAPAAIRTACLVVALVTIILVPLAMIAGDADMKDAHSWGAVGLIYAGPWGMSIGVAGYLARSASVAMLVAVVASIMLALVGPQMTDLIYSSLRPVLLATLLGPLVPLGLWLRLVSRRRPAQPG